MFWKKEYREDSGGAGCYRGGAGQVMEITHANHKAFAINSMFDRIIYPPRGRNGGGVGRNGRVYLKSGEELRGKGRQTIPSGDRLVLEMPGGGGLGEPFSRPMEMVAKDVLNGIVSLESAREDYGVILDGQGNIDISKTDQKRQSQVKD